MTASLLWAVAGIAVSYTALCATVYKRVYRHVYNTQPKGERTMSPEPSPLVQMHRLAQERKELAEAEAKRARRTRITPDDQERLAARFDNAKDEDS